MMICGYTSFPWLRYQFNYIVFESGAGLVQSQVEVLRADSAQYLLLRAHHSERHQHPVHDLKGWPLGEENARAGLGISSERVERVAILQYNLRNFIVFVGIC